MSNSTNTKYRFINPTYLRYIGPGIIWAMTAVGQTHVILSTYAGTKYGFDLLWMVFLSHLLAYPVFEYGARYSMATGKSLIHAYLQMHPIRWLIIPFLFLTFTLLTPMLLASMGGVPATVLYAAFPSINFSTWVIIIAAGTILLILSGKYKLLEKLNLVMAALLLVGILIAFSFSPPSLPEFSAGLIPSFPEDGIFTLVALMRLPSDAATALMLSAWALNHAEKAGEENRLETMNGVIFGFRVGYCLSLIVAVVFLSLGATVLHPLGVDLEGIDLALQLSRVFTDTVGAWTFPFFIIIAFISLYAGYYAAAQSIPLLFADLLARVRSTPTQKNLPSRWVVLVHLFLVVIVGVLIAIGFAKPTFLVLLSVSLGLIGLPLYYALNIFAVTRLIDPIYRPSLANRLLAFAGLIFGIIGISLFLYSRVLGG